MKSQETESSVNKVSKCLDQRDVLVILVNHRPSLRMQREVSQWIFNLSNWAARALHPILGAHLGTRPHSLRPTPPIPSRRRPFLPTPTTEVFRRPRGSPRGASKGISDQLNSRMISTRFRSSSSHTLARFELKTNVCSQTLITYLCGNVNGPVRPALTSQHSNLTSRPAIRGRARPPPAASVPFPR